MTKFSPPTENWSKMPHELINTFPEIETLGELKVILYILRHTWGFQDDQKKITLDEFVNGRKRRDRTRLDNGTGLSRGTVRNGLERAEAHGFIEVEIDDSDLGRVKKHYSLCIGGIESSSQGVKDQPPGVQKSTPRGPKVTPPTEKDTTSKIPEKDTPPRGKSSRVSAGSSKVPNVHPAVLAFRDETKYYPPKSWFPDLEKITDLDRWRAVVHAWVGLGRNPRNVARMFDHYQNNEMPTVKGVKRAKSRGGYKQHQKADPDTVRAFADARKRLPPGVESLRPGPRPGG